MTGEMTNPCGARRGVSVRTMVFALAVAVAMVAGYLAIESLARDARFDRQREQVELARRELANVPDLGAVFKTVGRAVEPSVVNIIVAREVRPTIDPRRRFFQEQWGLPEPPPMQAQGSGSGVIMEVENGHAYIITNHHVVADASEINVNLYDGRLVREVRLVGIDPKSDLAVLRIRADRVIPAEWGDSELLEKGEIVLAFGSPFGFVGSMTQGIVSAKNRQAGIIGGEFAYEDFLQVDAAINPGNSGGPLVNLRGQVVGINTAIATRSGGFQGIGLSIPSNQARQVFEQIKADGAVIRGFLGVRIADVRSAADEVAALGFTGDEGVLVAGVTRGSPAQGVLRAGDIITRLNQTPMPDSRILRNTVAATRPGTVVSLEVFRDGQSITLEVTIGEQPDDSAPRALLEPDRRAIPDADDVLESLGLRLTSVTRQQLRQLGVDQFSGGAVVQRVARGSPADAAGLVVGDVIVRVGGNDVPDADAVRDALAAADLSRGVPLVVLNRQGSRMTLLRVR